MPEIALIITLLALECFVSSWVREETGFIVFIIFLVSIPTEVVVVMKGPLKSVNLLWAVHMLVSAQVRTC